MTPLFGRLALLTGALVLAAPIAGPAQEYFREYGTSLSSGGIGPVSASDYSYRDVSPSGLAPLDPNAMPSSDVDNFAIGPIRFSLAVGFGVEFNDNINYSETHRESDIVLRPNLTLDAFWRVSDRNVLRFSLGASYAKYLNHSEFDTDGVLISPTSALEYTFGLGSNLTVSLRERFSYQEDPYDVANISNTAKYGRYENQAGVELKWDVSSVWRISADYDHYNLWSKEDVFSDQDRAIDTISIKPSYAISDTLRVGLNAAYSHISFDSDDRSDGNNFMVGPYIQWTITPQTNAFLEVGYQTLQFDGPYTPTQAVDALADQNDLTSAQQRFLLANSADTDEDSSSFYARLEVNNKPSENFQHRLTFSKTTEIGFYSNYYDLYHGEYSIDWRPFKNTEVSPTVFYEYYESSGAFGENASRLGAALGIRQYLTKSITLGLDYRFIRKDSNLEGFDYYQNLGFVSLYYKF